MTQTAVPAHTTGAFARHPLPAASASATVAAAQQTFIPLHWKLAVGGVAGATGVAATFPLDIVKTRLQGGHGAPGGAVATFSAILRADGVRGLYRGLPPTLVGVLPEKAIKLAVNEQLREAFTDDNGHLPLSRQVLAGAGAGFAQVVATNPTEIVKIRLQTQAGLPAHERQSAAQVVRSLGLRGLYKGAGACLLRDIPYAVIFFPLYAELRDAFADAEGRTSVPFIILAGAAAGAVAAGFCTPADVIKTRSQMRGAQFAGTADCFRKVVAAEGYGALLKGAVPRMMVQAPLFGITLAAFELQKRYMESL
ncbi:hypothetical protein PybrP1_012036 [[Pythium] brassicae (nom. inval.)]|nr:hypothetical protein PybrP1_012036 [[Pythium] brassicae (nom. inval.)]